MPFSRPTLSQLRNLAAQDLNANLPGADALLRFSNLRVLSVIQAGLAHMQYGYLDWIALQATPFKATDEYLEAWGVLRNIPRKPCAQASGVIVFTTTGDASIDAGAGLTRSDGLAYTVSAAAVSDADSSTIQVSASANPDPAGLTGANGDCAAGTQFTLANAVPYVNSTGTALTAFDGGADIETDDDYRQRVLYAYQNSAQGGAQSDYVEWALAVAGVTRAWCTGSGYGPGTVVVYFMMDNVNSAYDGFPQGADGCATLETRDASATGDQVDVAKYIYPLRPVTALVYVVAPLAYGVDMTIQGVPDAQQAAALDAVATLMKAEGAPGGTVVLAHVWAAISAVPGIDDFLILSPERDIELPAGSLPVPGTITWLD